ncbi:MAG: transglutaminase TgpA family protein [Candidatus Rokuibacteriota bacterium]
MVPTTLRIALYLLVLDGVAALYLGEFLGPPGIAAAGVALVLCWWHAGWRHRIASTSRVARAVVPLVAVASVVDVLYLAETALDALVRLLFFLIFYKLLTLGSVRDTRTVAFLAFFMLVAASASAFGVGFLFVFVTFVVLATWVLMLQQVLSESDAGQHRTVVGPNPRGARSRALFGLALGASVGAALITGALFFVIPRVGLAALPLRAPVGQMVTGFSDRVELGTYGTIETNESVVMRVHIPDVAIDAGSLPNLRWRGIVFDTFDGRAWIVQDPRRMVFARTGGEFRVGTPRGTGPILTQEIYLEPIGTDIIFSAPQALRFKLRADTVQVDDMGSVSVSKPLARLSYTVESELEAPWGPGALSRGAPVTLSSRARARFLQLPPLPPRIPALAREVAAGSRDPYETARRLTHFLSREFRYTLTLERLTNLDPLEEFLFVRRAGNCEYFAASLAVMLRSLGVPARVVGGFQRGEWNPYGQYFMVRLADAHSWVEAYVGDVGWITFDPSPRGTAQIPEMKGMLSLYLDALRMQWYRYVINWSIRDQVDTAVTIRRQALAWRTWLAALGQWGDWRSVVAAVMAVVAGVLAMRWRRGGRRAKGTRGRVRTLRFYERALRALARHGLRPEGGETAREFCARAGQFWPICAAPFARLTTAYEHCRFGAAPLSSVDEAELDACLAALDRPR